jgi:hypothetical protein
MTEDGMGKYEEYDYFAQNPIPLRILGTSSPSKIVALLRNSLYSLLFSLVYYYLALAKTGSGTSVEKCSMNTSAPSSADPALSRLLILLLSPTPA